METLSYNMFEPERNFEASYQPYEYQYASPERIIGYIDTILERAGTVEVVDLSDQKSRVERLKGNITRKITRTPDNTELGLKYTFDSTKTSFDDQSGEFSATTQDSLNRYFGKSGDRQVLITATKSPDGSINNRQVQVNIRTLGNIKRSEELKVWFKKAKNKERDGMLLRRSGGVYKADFETAQTMIHSGQPQSLFKYLSEVSASVSEMKTRIKTQTPPDNGLVNLTEVNAFVSKTDVNALIKGQTKTKILWEQVR